MRGIIKTYKVILLLLLHIASIFVGLIIAIFPNNGIRIRVATACMSIWASYTCSILGIRIKKIGLQRIPPGSLIVANHCSYLDILVLGSLIPGVFVAKQEVASWPLLGWLSRLAGTIFVDRGSRMSVVNSSDAIERRLTSDISVLLFPEGTTNDGTDILAFKSSLFRIPAEKNRPVQPVSLVYSHIDGNPVGRSEKDCVAWHGAMSLLPHLWHMLGINRIDVQVQFSPTIQDITGPSAVATRKLVCSMARASVVAGYQSLLAEKN
jgi:1-acyl-sn-glycerol-3-phosphate acyltransferase